MLFEEYITCSLEYGEVFCGSLASMVSFVNVGDRLGVEDGVSMTDVGEGERL